MSSYIEPTIGERLASARTLQRQGYIELNEGHLRVASETFWRAAKTALKAEARRRGWDHASYSELFHTAYRISQESDDQSWSDWFERASELRRDSIKQEMDSSEIRERGHVVDQLIRAILEMKRSDDALSPGDWLNLDAPQDLRKVAFERLLAGDLAAASDSYWEAVYLACRELAERLGWDPLSFPNQWKFMSDLEMEFRDNDAVRNGLAKAQFMHNGAAEGWLSESAIREHDAVVRDLIGRLEKLP